MVINEITMDSKNLLQKILWDYSIPASKCYNVLLGTEKKLAIMINTIYLKTSGILSLVRHNGN